MEKQHVTNHTWQSMKYRYRVRLAKRESEAVEVATTEEQAEAAEGEAKVMFVEVVGSYAVIYLSLSHLSFNI